MKIRDEVKFPWGRNNGRLCGFQIRISSPPEMDQMALQSFGIPCAMHGALNTRDPDSDKLVFAESMEKGTSVIRSTHTFTGSSVAL